MVLFSGEQVMKCWANHLLNESLPVLSIHKGVEVRPIVEHWIYESYDRFRCSLSDTYWTTLEAFPIASKNSCTSTELPTVALSLWVTPPLYYQLAHCDSKLIHNLMPHSTKLFNTDLRASTISSSSHLSLTDNSSVFPVFLE